MRSRQRALLPFDEGASGYERRQESSAGDILGGLTIIDVADESAAKAWGGRIAEACGWPQQIRRVS